MKGPKQGERLPQPSARGRLVRVAIGVAIGVSLLLTSPEELANPDGLFWVLLGIAVWETAGAWEILLGLSRGRIATGVLSLVGVVLGLLGTAEGSGFWSAPLQVYAYTWLAGVLGIQAVSFLLAGTISTPGCEWRAIPHLIATLSGRKTHFATCRLHIESLDRTESRSPGQTP